MKIENLIRRLPLPLLSLAFGVSSAVSFSIWGESSYIYPQIAKAPLSSLSFTWQFAINFSSQLIFDIFVLSSVGTYRIGYLFFAKLISFRPKALVQKLRKLLWCAACFYFGFVFIAGLLGSMIVTRIPDAMIPKQ